MLKYRPGNVAYTVFVNFLKRLLSVIFGVDFSKMYYATEKWFGLIKVVLDDWKHKYNEVELASLEKGAKVLMPTVELAGFDSQKNEK